MADLHWPASYFLDNYWLLHYWIEEWGPTPPPPPPPVPPVPGVGAIVTQKIPSRVSLRPSGAYRPR